MKSNHSFHLSRHFTQIAISNFKITCTHIPSHTNTPSQSLSLSKNTQTETHTQTQTNMQARNSCIIVFLDDIVPDMEDW